MFIILSEPILVASNIIISNLISIKDIKENIILIYFPVFSLRPGISMNKHSSNKESFLMFFIGISSI